LEQKLSSTRDSYGPIFRWFLPTVGIALTIPALLWLYQGLDLKRFLSAIATVEPIWLLVLTASILLEQLIRGWKWRQILFDLKPISSVRLFGAILAGYGVAVLVPLGVSPFVRSWLISRLEGLRWACVLMTSVIERFLDGIVFALLAALIAIVGQVSNIEGDVRTGLVITGSLSLLLFSGLLWLLFFGRSLLNCKEARVSLCIDWLAARGGTRLDGVRSAIRAGIVWPQERRRQIGAVLASFLMKVVSATHFLWAGLAVGVVLAPFDYLFLMVIAGFALVLARFVRVPVGFVLGSAFALKHVGVADEQALAMILFNHVLSIVLMVGLGLLFLWRSGIDIRLAQQTEAKANVTT